MLWSSCDVQCNRVSLDEIVVHFKWMAKDVKKFLSALEVNGNSVIDAKVLHSFP